MRLRFQKGDFLAVALVLLLAVAVGLLFLPQAGSEAAAVEIYMDGQLVKIIPLSEQVQFTVEGEYTNVIEVSGGKVAIIESSCPGMDCVHSGAISTTGRSLVCLPNGLEVRVVGTSGGVDFVVG